jgi:hypothetical protein
MGTRGFTGFIFPDGTLKGSYNHFDMYPTGHGRDIADELAEFAKNTGDDDPYGELLSLACKIRWVSADDRAEMENLPEEEKDWYWALREDHGSILSRLRRGIATDESNFLRDSLFCEFGYVLDFRTNEFAILVGFNQHPDLEAPYCKYTDNTRDGPGSKYVGCRELWRSKPGRKGLLSLVNLDMNKLEEQPV